MRTNYLLGPLSLFGIFEVLAEISAFISSALEHVRYCAWQLLSPPVVNDLPFEQEVGRLGFPTARLQKVGATKARDGQVRVLLWLHTEIKPLNKVCLVLHCTPL